MTIASEPAALSPHPVELCVVSPFYPWPDDHGDALRRLLVLDAVVAEAPTSRLLLARRADTTDADVQALRRRYPLARIEEFPLWRLKGSQPLHKLARLASALRRGCPPWLLRQWSPALAKRVAELRPARVLLIGESAALYVRSAPAARVMWDKSNVLAASDLDTALHADGVLARLRAFASYPLSYRFESRALRGSSSVVVSTDEERGRLARHYRVDSHTVRSAVRSAPERVAIDPAGADFVWMSSFNYLPNWDGLRRFLRANGSLMDREGLRLRVVGRGASSAQERELARWACVDYVGYAPDLVSALQGVRAAVVPIWAGAGLKLKTLTFMELGVPVLATPTALEGLPRSAAAAVITTPAAFGPAMVRLGPAAARNAAAKALAAVEHDYESGPFLEQMRKRIRVDLLEERPHDRR